MQRPSVSIFALIIVLFGKFTISQSDGNFSTHPCRRICHIGERNRLCEYSLTIEQYSTMSYAACGNCPHSPDDCLKENCLPGSGYRRPVLTANRLFPGPAIEVCRGDRVRVRVINALKTGESVSLHFRGVRQKSSQFMDGVPMITQCPIQPSTSFEYDFFASEAGTFYWHSHTGLQRVDGLAGAFIVRDGDDPHHHLYDIDNHPPILLQDWYDKETAASRFATLYGGTGDSPSAHLLVNGISDQLSASVIPKFRLDSRWRHRFRVINNALLDCPMTISIENHDLVLIANDGHSIKPQPTKKVMIFPGESFDFVPFLTGNAAPFRAKNYNYELKVLGANKCSSSNGAGHFQYINDIYPSQMTAFDATLGFVNTTAMEVESIQRSFEPDLMELVIINRTLDDIGILLDSLENDPSITEQSPDVYFTVEMDFENASGTNKYWPYRDSKSLLPRLNQITSEMPSAPLLSQLSEIPPSKYCNAYSRQCDSSEFCECIHLVHIPLNSLVEFTLINNDRTHRACYQTVHLHGYHLHVIAMKGLREFNISEEDVKKAERNGSINWERRFAVQKDTLTIAPGSFAITRFRADNPGFWLLHSHNENQMLMGMSLIVYVGTMNDMPPRPRNWPTCGSWSPPAPPPPTKLEPVTPEPIAPSSSSSNLPSLTSLAILLIAQWHFSHK